jgi:hypothetical protein
LQFSQRLFLIQTGAFDYFLEEIVVFEEDLDEGFSGGLVGQFALFLGGLFLRAAAVGRLVAVFHLRELRFQRKS